MKVALINMPFGVLWSPSQALGLFRAYFSQLGIESKCFDLNLELSSRVGVSKYNEICSGLGADACPNWCFARKAFGVENVSDEFSKGFLLHLAAAGHNATVVREMRSRCEDFVDEIAQDNRWKHYDIFGFTALSIQLNASLAMARCLKERFPKKIMIIGGPSVFSAAGIEFSKKTPSVDFFFTSSADVQFPELVQCLDQNRPFSYLTDMAYQGKQETNHLYEDDIIDMNSVPIPDYSDYFETLNLCHTDKKERGPISIPIEISRGCYYGNKKCCSFCADVSLSKKQYKPRSTKNAIKYLEETSQRYYPQAVKMVLSDPLVPAGFVQKILKPWADIKLNDISLFFENKPWFTRDDVKIMKQVNVTHIQVGIESLHAEIIKLMRKGDSLYQCIETMKYMKMNKIKLSWNLLWRVPGEKKEWYVQMYQIMKKLRHLEPPGIFAPVAITKQSPYWEERDSFNFKNLRPHFLYNDVFPSYLDLESIAWYFDYDDNKEENAAEYKLIEQERLNWKELQEDFGPELKYEGNDVIDTRNVSTKVHCLKPLQYNILLFCDSAKTERKIKESFPSVSCDILDELVERDLMICDLGKYITLVIATDKDLDNLRVERQEALSLSLEVLA